jgi:hypothetical protein
VRLPFAVLLLIVAAACGGARPPDTSPTIATGVVGGRLLLPAGEPVTPGMTVRVAGTAVSAEIDSFGAFVLPNVPAGPLELHFTGLRPASVLDAGQIAGGETITLNIRVGAGGVSLDAIARVRGTDATIEGVIEAPGAAAGTLPPNTIIVGGRTVQLQEGQGADLKPGMRVRATGTVSAAGIIARHLAIL